MKIVLLGLSGAVLGAIPGGMVGFGLGLIWTGAVEPGCGQGPCAAQVWFTFLPSGLILGALLGALILGYFGSREDADARGNGN